MSEADRSVEIEDSIPARTVYVPLRDLANMRDLLWERFDAYISEEHDDRVQSAVAAALSPGAVARSVRQMLAEFRVKDRSSETYDDETGLPLEGTLVLLPGIEVEVRVNMRRRAAIVHPDATEEDIERIATTVHPSNRTNLLLSVLERPDLIEGRD